MTNRIDFMNGKAVVGGKEVGFEPRVIRDRFRMYAPAQFAEDKNLISNYTYLFSRDKSPLSIAIKYAPSATPEDRERQIALYFNQGIGTLESTDAQDGQVLYRETVTESKFLSVYSLRFAVDTAKGMLFGCFNCSAAYKDDWRPVVLEMLRHIEPVAG